MTTLVTGASGFVGGHVVAALQAAGVAVLSPSRRSLDLTRPATFDAWFAAHRPEAVINCAAYGVDHRRQDPALAVAVNAVAPAALYLAAARFGVRRFVHAGTALEYGPHRHPITEATPLRPCGLYGSSKAAGSLNLAAAAHARLHPVIARCFSLYGPGEGAHKLVPQVVAALTAATPLPMTAGTQVRDYLYVGDAARALAALAHPGTAAPSPPILNICSGRGVSVRELALAVAGELGADPALLQFGTLRDRTESIERCVGDPA
ncbi:MAG: NAD-dependent epimerase/dehydratase family protein, partial [Planctomycetota bacterium]